jgi:hypothetical protein
MIANMPRKPLTTDTGVQATIAEQVATIHTLQVLDRVLHAEIRELAAAGKIHECDRRRAAMQDIGSVLDLLDGRR